MVRKQGSQSLAVDTFERLQQVILDGRFIPGERLRPAELAEQYGVSTSVIREALIRLSEKRLIEVSPNRGFTVMHAGMERLRDLIEVRVANETAALQLAIERGDMEWESSVVAAHHRLTALTEQTPGSVDEWFIAHLAFHEALLSGCGNSYLIEVCAELLRAGDLYLRWFGHEAEKTDGRVLAGRDHAAEHAAILQATLDRDADLATSRYERHLQLTGSSIAETESRTSDTMSNGAAEGVCDI
ncbi:DNA-binding transcriptional regulator, GntR family [Prauserella aidingensis]|uniref:GntR family transcriptional regulator n=1 Tax=Prauserella aidingensis TaxID=387890 RepID=UPI0020A2E0BB|nr:GntR family transcriptional regulator [Prauserella aidingensis]MCP2256259.1 DNA-binding transcriptional regulator, GntR family [Prauserella aidingensis]